MSMGQSIGRPIGRTIGVAISPVSGGGVSAFGSTKAKLIDGNDATILAIGDSTGNGADEWIYLFAADLADKYPTHSVIYHLYDAGAVGGANAWGSPVSVSTGSTAAELHIWNASVATTNPTYLLGARKAVAIDSVTPDMIIWNHGQNTTSFTDEVKRDCFFMGFENVRLSHPGVPAVVMLQNPRRDDDLMASVISTVREICDLYGDVTYIEGYNRFIAAGKPAGWYTDEIHPNATGSAELAAAAIAVFVSSGRVSRPVEQAFLATLGSNLLPNGDFSAWPGALPTSWSSANSATATKELTIKPVGAAYSALIEGTTAQAGIFAAPSSPGGKTVTLAALVFVPTGSALGVGRQRISEDGLTEFSYGGLIPQGGWFWSIMSFTFTAAPTTARAFALCDTSANAGSKAYFAQMSLVEGIVPRRVS
jgi:hypothetical protein